MAYRRTAAVQQRLDGARARVLAAAHALVAEQGWAGCTVAAVAARAGVATGTVYRHVPDKTTLLVEVFRAATQREVDAVTAAAAAPGTATARVAALTTAFGQRALRSPRLAYALIAEPVDPAVERERLRYRAAYRAIVADVVTAGIATGELPPQDPDVTAAALVGALAEALVLATHPDAPRPLSPDPAGTVVPALTDLVTRALGGPR
ncbi:TetR/AcrR family transcriptional regulator [Nocardioides sp.]|uniref:TetR/AcrR family transcriptional regulator n=1 Tax=Nocardioides sp. TaxID=35761 RepID=UPI00351145A3